MQKDARRCAVEALMQLHREQGFSNIVVDNYLSKSDWKPEEKGLFSFLVYGVEERKITLDYFIQKFSKTPIKRMHPCVLEALRIAVYQLLFMNRIPVSAAVNESVKIVRAMGQSKATGLVNAILRNILRTYNLNQDDIELERIVEVDGLIEKKEIVYSCPKELISIWESSYGENVADSILETINQKPPAIIRINTLTSSDEEFESFIEKEHISAQKISYLEHAFLISDGFERQMKKYDDTKWYYQDAASQLCVKAANAQEGNHVMDVCAAPGGKSLGIAQTIHNNGRILCSDIYPQKCDELYHRAQKLHASCIETLPRDASSPCVKKWEESFDLVICDVPCSGFGVIRRRPEIRYHDLEQSSKLPKLQKSILEESAKMVKPGGYIQYSTCTLNIHENEEVVESFLESHSEFEPEILQLDEFYKEFDVKPDWKLTLFPHLYNTDGFFIARMRRKER